MPSRDQIIQSLARMYREETDSSDIDLARFADYLIAQGVRPPPIPTGRELMAKAAKRALKQEIRRDSTTGNPYHGWHAVPQGKDQATGQLSFTYVDIDDAPREPMQKALVLRVGMMVDDGVQVTFDAQHWNSINPTEEPINVEEMMDLRDPVQWRINANAPDDDGEGEPIDPSSV